MDLICKWCKETKPHELFTFRWSDQPPSQRNCRVCKECWSVYQKRRYKNNPTVRAKQLRANAMWRKAHPDEMARYAKKHIDAYPAQVKARNRVRYNIRRGFWTKQPCEVCLGVDVEAHHDSYAEPHWETVRWLCKAHHEQWHQQLDPVKSEILAEPLAEVERLRQGAAQIQAQITALREQFREKHAKANALELSTWNKVVEAAQPMFEEFLRLPA